MVALRLDLMRYWVLIKSIGVTPEMEEYEKRKMSIFNQLNFLGIVTGIVVPIIGIFFNDHLPPLGWFVAGSPLAISVIVLWLNYEKYYEHARLVYFSLYPIATCLVYLGKVDIGVELFFVLYGVLSVFFLQQITHILFAFSLSVACYFIACIIPHDFYFRLVTVNYYFYVFNHLTAISFIFYAIYFIKQENTGYHFSLLSKSDELRRRNMEVELQKQEIAQKASLLEEQTAKLTELNQLKNKLFSVIAHDLKTPMYALRNLFNHMHLNEMPVKEMKALLPGIVNEMNYTTNLMENLLQWAKSQMENAELQPEVLDIENMISRVLLLLHWQASNKRIHLESQIEEPLYCYADKEMVNLVLRNLLSNAIKFTRENGHVRVGARESASSVEIYVQDDGVGISAERQQQLFGDMFYSTKGTNEETGTGLGLKLCKDFLEKNGGRIAVKSQPGKGSTFTVTLPRPKD
ncbi:sensor histidine kinase [Longitalea luteola]|uniref:sensor histidine kinase n=1 Tax=Longitalea luteola TaxID=2812563 RepID=UPI001A956A42|nr:HAMP domain-containing sensor histidine kinase [Longitalea luteola]